MKVALKNKTYGIPYMGSKSAIAEWICSYLPPAENFYDLFAGGCAVTHAALVLKNYKHYFVSDINPMPVNLFLDAAHGKMKGETRWISHEDFDRLYKTDAVVAYLWSFGNNPAKGYMYSREIEPFKKALHYAIFYKDISLLEACGYKGLEFVKRYDNRVCRYAAIKQYLRHLKNEPHWCESQNTERNNTLQSLAALEHLETLSRLEHLETLSRLEHLETLSYDKVPIRENSVLYCDIPYQGTASYLGGFNHAQFYEWAQEQKEPVFVSSYDMPRSFVRIAGIRKRVTLCADNNKNSAIEGLFVPASQIDKGIVKYKR